MESERVEDQKLHLLVVLLLSILLAISTAECVGELLVIKLGGIDESPQLIKQLIHTMCRNSVTHGAPRNHIRTLAAGLSEGESGPQSVNCPCSNPGHPDNAYPPSFVGNNYYCESGNPTNTFINYHLYSNDSLWDGKQHEGECCSNGKSPPWFSVELSNQTTDDIEVRICMGQPSYDDFTIQLLELYIQ